METYKTIEEARGHAKNKNIATHIIQIDTKNETGVYICAKCSAETLRKCKPITEIKRIIGDVVDLAKEKYEEKENKKQKNIPGLTELEKIIMDWDYYQKGFRSMMENEMNDGVFPPKRPEIEVAEVAKKYPAAAAYVKAGNWSMASNLAKSATGDKAKKAIESGTNYKAAITQMEKEWAAHCDKNKLN